MDKETRKVFKAWYKEQNKTFRIEDYCFDKQIEFITSPAPFKTACCSRRAGKTVADAFYLLDSARKRSEVVCLYITLTRANGKRLIWPELLKINRKFNLGAMYNETELSLKFPNGSVIYVSGAKDQREIEKFRGLPLYLCIIDECQSFKPFIENLIDEVIAKALFDYGGTLALTGTPGPVPVGYFYDVCHSKAYAHFAWTMFDNPHMQIKSGMSPQEILDRDLARKGVTVDDPTIQRECFGRWVLDADTLVYRYEKKTNDYSELPPGKYNYVLGVDIGFEDADALAVLAWTDIDKTTYLVHERVTSKQGISDLVRQIEECRVHYPFHKIVMDMGGLGKKIGEEITRRHHIPVQAAEKSRKFENIELFNDDLRTGRFKAKSNSVFSQDCIKLEWDDDKSTPERKVVSDRFHSDICDAVLYAWRESYSFTSEPLKEVPKWGTPEWQKQEVEKMEDSAEEYFKKQSEQENNNGIF